MKMIGLVILHGQLVFEIIEHHFCRSTANSIGNRSRNDQLRCFSLREKADAPQEHASANQFDVWFAKTRISNFQRRSRELLLRMSMHS
jgi:hypothetical protein